MRALRQAAAVGSSSKCRAYTRTVHTARRYSQTAQTLRRSGGRRQPSAALGTSKRQKRCRGNTRKGEISLSLHKADQSKGRTN
jgi:hypothetical protein